MKMQNVSFGDLNIQLQNKDQAETYNTKIAKLNRVDDSCLIESSKDYTDYDCEGCDGFNFKSTPSTEKEMMALLLNTGARVRFVTKDTCCEKVNQHTDMDEFSEIPTESYSDLLDDEGLNLMQNIEQQYPFQSDAETLEFLENIEAELD